MKTWDQMTDAEKRAERIRLDAAYVAERKRETEWLANLKVGDEVAITGGWHPRASRVTRETPRYWIVDGGKYRKDNGYGTDSGFRRGRICELDQDIRDEADARRLANELLHVRWSLQPVGLLRAIKTLLEYRDQHVTGIVVHTEYKNCGGYHSLPGWNGLDPKA